MDGKNITDIPAEWSNTIGYVPQMVFLADTSIRKNVAFGEYDSEIDDERINEALKKADLWKFIESLPDGVDTYVGDRGVRLSGGQRQRIAIARALMSRPELLLMDEPSMGLAPILVQEIFKTIEKINKENNVTILLVEQNAHMALSIANRAYVLETGKIIMSGDANELANNDDIKKAYLGG